MRSKYSSVQIILHWLVFFLVVMAYSTMEFKNIIFNDYQILYSRVHFSVGILVLILMVCRLLLRFCLHTPPVIPKPRAVFTGMSHLVHLLMYLMFISLPILGALSLYFRGTDWSALSIAMPVAVNPDEDIEYTLLDYHQMIAKWGYAIIGLHAMAALIHHYWWKDNTFIRILPERIKR